MALASRFVRDQIETHLDNTRTGLEEVARMTKQLPPDERDRVQGRVKTFQDWEQKSREILRVAVKIVERSTVSQRGD